MTSQIEDIDTLKAEAKALGMKGYGPAKDAEKLAAKIEEFKATMSDEPVVETPAPVQRKKAPRMSVLKTGESRRADLIARLEREDPDCKYLTQSASMTPAEASAKGFEIVTKSGGEYLYCGNDIVVRTDKESYYEWQNNRTEQSLQAMRSIDKDLKQERGGRKIQALRETEKQGIDPDVD